MIDPADERIFEADRHPIRYLFREGRGPELMVVFSGFDPINRQRYNYVRHLEGVPPHRMYVLDDLGDRGCYYLGQDRELFVAAGVRGAIQHELDQLGIGTEQLVTAGSSKGGSAACYFGLQLGCRVLAGAPQYYIGNYVTEASAAVAVCRLIAGGSAPGDVAWLDDVLPQAIDAAAPSASIHLFSSPNDSQFETHIEPMMQRLAQAGVEHELTMGSYAPHGAVGEQFGPWMRERANEIGGARESAEVAAALMDANSQALIRALVEGNARVEELCRVVELEPHQIELRLGRLRSLGLTSRDWLRRWQLTEEGARSGVAREGARGRGTSTSSRPARAKI